MLYGVVRGHWNDFAILANPPEMQLDSLLEGREAEPHVELLRLAPVDLQSATTTCRRWRRTRIKCCAMGTVPSRKGAIEICRGTVGRAA